jgi:molybdate transport system regulatory protein
VVLLERIQEYGSISAAARSMGMGYRHAWELVEQMNRLSPKKLVAKKTGGEGGGGAVLTPHGETAITRFWELVNEFREWLSPLDPEIWERRQR